MIESEFEREIDRRVEEVERERVCENCPLCLDLSHDGEVQEKRQNEGEKIGSDLKKKDYYWKKREDQKRKKRS